MCSYHGGGRHGAGTIGRDKLVSRETGLRLLRTDHIKGAAEMHAPSLIRSTGKEHMAKDLAEFAKEKGIKYFMISFTDLFGGQRAKLVPARAIACLLYTSPSPRDRG